MTHDDDATDREFAALLRRIGTAVVPVEDETVHAEREAHLVPSLSHFAGEAFRKRDRARRRRYAWFAVAALVMGLGVVALVFGTLRTEPTSGASVVAEDGAVQVEGDALSDGAERKLRISDRIETLAGHAEVALASGASVALDAMTRVEVEAQSRAADVSHERLALPTGRIAVRVPKLGRGSLVIDTPNALVTVHGTRFSVDVRPATGEWSVETRVAVSEGLVSVLSGGREVFLGPGARWTSTPSGADVLSPDSGVAPTPLPNANARVKTSPRSSLARETELFRAALEARRKGDPRGAIEYVNQLLGKYPSSPLATDARAERAGALAELKRPLPP
jgi:ferric-dicitrate binding protein FerR (iron transport regulator)